jgi:hypothetical protein
VTLRLSGGVDMQVEDVERHEAAPLIQPD